MVGFFVCLKIIKKELKWLKTKNEKNNNKLKFIDLFAGIGGIRLGFEGDSQNTECVYSSEHCQTVMDSLDN